MTGTCKLNNKSMRTIRREQLYQGIAIDLALLGVISREECEVLIGGKMPTGMVLPNGQSSLVTESEVALNENVVTEPESEPVETEEPDEPESEPVETETEGE